MAGLLVRIFEAAAPAETPAAESASRLADIYCVILVGATTAVVVGAAATTFVSAVIDNLVDAAASEPCWRESENVVGDVHTQPAPT